MVINDNDIWRRHENYTKIAINHDLEHSSMTNCFLIVLYHVVQLRFDNSQYMNMLCYVMYGTDSAFIWTINMHSATIYQLK